jgi:hypothetical protein
MTPDDPVLIKVLSDELKIYIKVITYNNGIACGSLRVYSVYMYVEIIVLHV